MILRNWPKLPTLAVSVRSGIIHANHWPKISQLQFLQQALHTTAVAFRFRKKASCLKLACSHDSTCLPLHFNKLARWHTSGTAKTCLKESTSCCTCKLLYPC